VTLESEYGARKEDGLHSGEGSLRMRAVEYSGNSYNPLNVLILRRVGKIKTEALASQFAPIKIMTLLNPRPSLSFNIWGRFS
jgi:hypothetical protein